jgi:hypothetical protein
MPIVMSRRTLPFVLVAVVALSATIALAGAPKSPLGQWMRPNMSAPLAGGDFDTLKSSFDLVASKTPSGDYGNWASLSQQGSAAAANKDLAGVKASCKGCHDAYKNQYLKEHASTPFP